MTRSGAAVKFTRSRVTRSSAMPKLELFEDDKFLNPSSSKSKPEATKPSSSSSKKFIESSKKKDSLFDASLLARSSRSRDLPLRRPLPIKSSKRGHDDGSDFDDDRRGVDIKRTKFVKKAKSLPPKTWSTKDFSSSLAKEATSETQARSGYDDVSDYRNLAVYSDKKKSEPIEKKGKLLIPDSLPLDFDIPKLKDAQVPKESKKKRGLVIPEAIDYLDIPLLEPLQPKGPPRKLFVPDNDLLDIPGSIEITERKPMTQKPFSGSQEKSNEKPKLVQQPSKNDDMPIRKPRSKLTKTFSFKERDKKIRLEQRRKDYAKNKSSQSLPASQEVPPSKLPSSPVKLLFTDDDEFRDLGPIVASTQVLKWEKEKNESTTHLMAEGSLEKLLKQAVDGMIVCLTCHRKVASARLKNFAKGDFLSTRQMIEFCDTHKYEDAEKAWEDLGLPVIRWERLNAKVKQMKGDLLKVLNADLPSTFRKRLEEDIAAGRNRNINSVRATLGYYGIRGMLIIQSAIYEHMGKDIQARALTDRTVFGRGWMFFTENVLVPETIVRLIMQDMFLEDEEAQKMLENTTWIGDVLNQDNQDLELEALQEVDEILKAKSERGEEGEEEDESELSSVADPIEKSQRSSSPVRGFDLSAFDDSEEDI